MPHLYSPPRLAKVLSEDPSSSTLRCLAVSLAANLCVYAGTPRLGYYLLAKQMVVNLYGTTLLDLMQHFPAYLLAYSIFVSRDSTKTFCRFAQTISL